MELRQDQEEVVDILEMEEEHSNQMREVGHKEDILGLDRMRILDLGEVVRSRVEVGRSIPEEAAKKFNTLIKLRSIKYQFIKF